MNWVLWLFRPIFGLGVVNTPCTINRQRWEVEGARRKITYNVSVASVLTSLLDTPLHVIDAVDATSATQQVIGATILTNGQISLNPAATPSNGILVEVVGL
jgi:hypothetical protein